MSETNRNCNEARELMKATLVLDDKGGADGFDVQVRDHLNDCGNCSAWARQMKEIDTVAASMVQYDVPESLTQNILRAVDAEKAHGKAASPSIVLLCVIAALMAAVFVIETHESVGGVISWTAGLALMYSMSLLVSSNKEAERA